MANAAGSLNDINDDPSTPVGLIRLLITDMDHNSPLFTNAEIEAFLALEGGNVKLAAAVALETIATSEALTSKVISTQDLSTNGPAVAKALMDRAKALREQAAPPKDPDIDPETGIPVDYGLEVIDFSYGRWY